MIPSHALPFAQCCLKGYFNVNFGHCKLVNIMHNRSIAASLIPTDFFMLYFSNSSSFVFYFLLLNSSYVLMRNVCGPLFYGLFSLRRQGCNFGWGGVGGWWWCPLTHLAWFTHSCKFPLCLKNYVWSTSDLQSFSFLYIYRFFALVKCVLECHVMMSFNDLWLL